MTINNRINSTLQSPAIRALLFLLATVLLAGQTVAARAADLDDAEAIPHIDRKARDAYYQLFRGAQHHRAFAIAPGGAWGWTQGEESVDAASAGALELCQEHSEQTCVLYALDDKVVFDRAAWSQLWRPYTPAAADPAEGLARGERFPDIAFVNADGQRSSITRLRGKIVLVHFWGSWCPPCLRELPTLDLLNQLLQDRLPEDVTVVLLQMREPINVSRAWIRQTSFKTLPLSDSGATSSEHDWLNLADGGKLLDREVAPVFPSTYVLDRNGVVLFSHTGPIPDWTEYLPFFEDAATHTAP